MNERVDNTKLGNFKATLESVIDSGLITIEVNKVHHVELILDKLRPMLPHPDKLIFLDQQLARKGDIVNLIDFRKQALRDRVIYIQPLIYNELASNHVVHYKAAHASDIYIVGRVSNDYVNFFFEKVRGLSDTDTLPLSRENTVKVV